MPCCGVQVYRGTWKHTDIAAKEYLPIEPAQEAPSSSKDLPSDAAMAHARAALAKEVHWLTSLNHPNLVRFCAVCLERPLVVMEFYKVRRQHGWLVLLATTSACVSNGICSCIRPTCHVVAVTTMMNLAAC